MTRFTVTLIAASISGLAFVGFGVLHFATDSWVAWVLTALAGMSLGWFSAEAWVERP